MTVFLRVLEAAVDDKAAELLRAMTALRAHETCLQTLEGVTFCREPSAFAAVPGSPFAYWVSDAVRGAFARYPRLENNYLATRGAYTTDDFKYFRLVWEVPAVGRATTREQTRGALAYVPLAKGGSFSPYYADIHLVVRWHDDGAEPKAFLSAYRERKGWGTDWSACLNGYSQYFRRGLTWPRRTNGLSFRVLPAGSIFGDKGPAVFVDDDSPQRLLALSAIVNSRAFGYLVSVQLARTELAQSYEVGLIQQTPVPAMSDTAKAAFARLARRAWSLKRLMDTTNETSHAFVLPTGISEKLTGLNRETCEKEVVAIQREIDDLAYDLYGIGPEDRVSMAVRSNSASAAPSSDDEAAAADASDEEEADGEVPIGAAADTLFSWLVGVAFGRFDPRLATGERAIPPEPEPFDPLPSRSPGMWPEGEEQETPPPDILVDDLGHRDDIGAHVAKAAGKAGLQERNDRRSWLSKEFFPLHIKMYSKSRRKAPIYWQLATPSASYSIWLYLHSFTKGTLYKVQESATHKVDHESRKLESLRHELGATPSAADRKTLSTQETFVNELRAFLDDVKRVAPLWNPNLDDGVIINFAPLWRLVPQHKSWQKELKGTWDALCDGKYDWAHLAMHLWPERVVPRCATDRSLAIAHGLENEFWLEGADGKWKARSTPLRPVDEIVRERSSAAVKAALDSLQRNPSTPPPKGKSKPRKAK